MTSGPLWGQLGPLGVARKAGLTWLIRDDFTTDEAAPIVSPRTCEPGPGTLTMVQADGQFSISGGALNFPAQVSPQWLDQGFYSGAQARVAGKALLVTLNISIPIFIIGWNRSAQVSFNEASTLYIPSLTDVRYRELGIDNPIFGSLTLSANVDYKIASILRTTGTWLCIKGGAFTNWTLMWVAIWDNSVTVYPFFINYSAVGLMRNIGVRQLPAPFDADYGLTTLHIASPIDATEYTGNADGITDMTITAPGVLDGLATTRCGFYYRADSDLTPAWHCYVDGAGAFRLDSIAADGTRTNRINVAGVIVGGATRTLRSIHSASLHDCYTLTSTTWTKRGSQVNVSLNDAVTTIEPSIPAGWTAANLDDWPRTLTVAQAAELDRV